MCLLGRPWIRLSCFPAADPDILANLPASLRILPENSRHRLGESPEILPDRDCLLPSSRRRRTTSEFTCRRSTLRSRKERVDSRLWNGRRFLEMNQKTIEDSTRRTRRLVVLSQSTAAVQRGWKIGAGDCLSSVFGKPENPVDLFLALRFAIWSREILTSLRGTQHCCIGKHSSTKTFL